MSSHSIWSRFRFAAGLFPLRGFPNSEDSLSVGGLDGLITIWDLASGQILVALEGHESPVLDVAFLGDGDTLVSVGDDQVRVWRATSLAEADGEMLKK